jgi:putative PIN family toxin of toxin-antitoxin system
LRLVFDTNIIISALLFEGSKPSKAFNIGIEQEAILFSSSTLTELEEVLWRNKFDQYISHEDRKQFLSSFILHATPVEPDETITECRDSKDNKFLELAVCGKADFIISGDEDLLILNPFRNIRILTPSMFINLHSK